MWNMHGSTGDIIWLGTQTDKLEPIFAEINREGLGPGRLRFLPPHAECLRRHGPLRVREHRHHGYLPHPDPQVPGRAPSSRLPYKFKIKVSGCANDCTAAVARADLSIIGTWRDSIRIDQAEVKNYASKMNIAEEIVGMCPTKCISFDGGVLKINDKDCNRCMHCINQMPKALRPGKEKGATIMLGARPRS